MKLIFTLILVCGSVILCSAQWSSFSTSNNVVCDTLSTLTNGKKVNLNAVKDNLNNTFVAWTDHRNNTSGTSNVDIFLQKISPTGNRLFNPGGVPVTLALADQAPNSAATMIYDGKGGVILAWQDSRNAATQSNDVYYQRLDSNGVRLFTISGSLDSNGLNVATTSVNVSQINPELVLLDDTFFAIVWGDSRKPNPSIPASPRNTLFYNKFRISDGSKVFATDFSVTTLGIRAESGQILMPDLNGGFFVAWVDNRNGTGSGSGLNNGEIYFQQIDGNMNPLLSVATNGLLVSGNAANNQLRPQMCSDNAGGAIIAWEDLRAGTVNAQDVYSQRVNASGSLVWTPTSGSGGGVQVTTATNDQEKVHIIADGSGNAILTWQDERTPNATSGGINNDVYATKLDGATGTKLWNDPAGPPTFGANDGNIPICTQGGDQPFGSSNFEALSLISDKSGGAIIVWEDGSNVTKDLYGMRVNNLGVKMWSPDQGAVIANASTIITPTAAQGSPIALSGIAPSGPDGAIIVFLDGRYSPVPPLTANETTSVFASYTSTPGFLTTLNLDKINLTVTKNTNNITLNWDATNNAFAVKYILQKSTDGIRFYDVAILNKTVVNNYKFIDVNPINGINYYKVKMILNTYQEKYSNTVKVLLGDNKNAVNFYPNPVVTNANVQINKMAYGNYSINILAVDGKVVAKQKIAISTDAYSLSLPLSVLAQGQYVFQLINAKGKTVYAQHFIKATN